MIFKQLFSPGYKSTDPQKRILSVSKLNKQDEKDKSILHELAFNDDDDDVSIAALSALDSFVLWVKAAEISESNRVKKHAKSTFFKQIENTNKVNDSLFTAFLKENKNKQLIEELLFSSTRLKQNSELAIDLLFSLQNENNIRRYYQDIASPKDQLAIVDANNDNKLLTRLSKYKAGDEVSKAIETKLAHMQFLKEQPIKIKQQATLINSRLLALKDGQEYEYLETQFTALCAEFEALKTDFTCLDEVSRESFTSKYHSLTGALKQKLSVLEVEYNKQIEIKQTTNDIAKIQNKCQEIKQQIDLIIVKPEQDENVDGLERSESLSVHSVDAEVNILSCSLNDALEELEQVAPQAQTQAHKQHIKQIRQEIKLMQKRLGKLTNTVVFAQQLKLLSADLANYSLQFDKLENVSQETLQNLKNELNTFKNKAQAIKAEVGDDLPKKILSQFETRFSALNSKKQQFLRYFTQLENKCDNKLKVVNRMISDGKFKPAMSTFYHIQKVYAQIEVTASKRIKNAYEQTLEEVTKLQELQAYIAEPRKPALLAQAEGLANGKFEDPYDRTDSVKQLRQEWTSLGNLHTEEDNVLNKAFDQAIETAFVPCRAFFAELERQRELAYENAMQIVQAAKDIDATLPAPELIAKISNLKKRFIQLGEIDKSKVQKVKREFNKALKPLNISINVSYEQNAQQKQNLIGLAEKLVTNIEAENDDSLKDAVQQAKELQQKWKSIGFAGKTHDNRLWQSFREVNDSLFNQYHQNLSEKKSAQTEQIQLIETQLIDIQNKLNSTKALAELHFYDESHAEVITKIGELDEYSRKKVLPKLAKLEQFHERCIERMTVNKKATALHDLFSFLRDYKSVESIENAGTLLSKYKTWLQSDITPLKTLRGLDRVALTQVAAIVHDKPYSEYPIGDESQRKEIQLKMMAAKLQGDEIILPEDVLAAWVCLGPIDESEMTSLDALEKLYTS